VYFEDLDKIQIIKGMYKMEFILPENSTNDCINSLCLIKPLNKYKQNENNPRCGLNVGA